MVGRPLSPKIELSKEELQALHDGASIRVPAEIQVTILGFRQVPTTFKIEIVAKDT